MRIAFGPYMRSGKDTACEYLKKRHGGIIFSFSERLYKTTRKIQKSLGFPIEKDRNLLLLVGKYATDKNSLIFVKDTEEKIKNTNKETNIFISDVRKPEEAEMLKKNGFTIIKIVRNHPEKTFSEMEEKMAETNYFDITIENNGTLEEFYGELEDIFG